MSTQATFVLLGSENNSTLNDFASYLETANRPFLRAHGKGDLRYSMSSHGDEPILRIETDELVLEGDDFSILVQEPYGLVDRHDSVQESFSSQEWFATFWSFCGVHSRVVNPPSVGAWGSGVCEPLLETHVNQGALPEELTAGSVDMLGDALDFSSGPVILAESLSTYERQFLKSQYEMSRSGEVNMGCNGLRTYLAAGQGQLVQLFVGQQSFTLSNDLGLDTETHEHRALCESIRRGLEPLQIGFFGVVFHLYGGMTRIGSVVRDVPAPWFETQADDVYLALTSLLEES